MPLRLLDTNVLVHATFRGAEFHSEAAELIDRGLRERGQFCLSPQNLVEFAAVVTRSRFVSSPLPPAEIRRIGDLLYRSRTLHKIYPSRGTVARAIREGTSLGIAGPKWYDLYLAMTMREAGVEVIVTQNVDDFNSIPSIQAITIRDAL